jgi:hypothetical protein
MLRALIEPTHYGVAPVGAKDSDFSVEGWPKAPHRGFIQPIEGDPQTVDKGSAGKEVAWGALVFDELRQLTGALIQMMGVY